MYMGLWEADSPMVQASPVLHDHFIERQREPLLECEHLNEAMVMNGF